MGKLFSFSNHFVPGVNAFILTVNSGADTASSGYIVNFVIEPSFPSTTYGYL
jgi:mannose-1-phosphate guanylyltransferase